ncbi:MAG: calcium-binding protein [Selenomonadaceae bacterium]|nr:calcium-binding protein [Selenomonadaceae bacterium]
MKNFNFDLQRFKDFNNTVSGVVITGTANSDSISNGKYSYSSIGSNVTINALGGNDSIDNYASNVTISGGAGNDYIENIEGEKATISGGDGNDTIRNILAKGTTINGGTGDDKISNYYGKNVTISGGEGNDSIENWGDSVTISGGSGDDTIYIDMYHSVASVYEYNTGDGNDVILGFKSNDTLLINGTRKKITKENDGDIIIGVGSNAITIKNYMMYNYTSDTVIIGTAYADSISNSYSGSNVTISGGTGDDTIYNYCDNVTISGGDGNDRIYNNSSKKVTINGGTGDDYISNNGDKVTISGGTGDDTISLSISASLSFIEYAKGDGNDLVQGFQDSDTLIISGTTYSTAKSGSDVIVTAGSGKITLQDAATLSNLNIQGAFSENNSGGGVNVLNNLSNVLISGTDKADSIWNNAGVNNVTINAYAGNDTIKSWGSYNYIDAGSDDDYIFHFPANSTIHAGTGNDTVSLYSSSSAGDVITYTSGDGNDLIQSFKTKDTLIISGTTYSTSKSGNDVIVTAGSGKITLEGAASLSSIKIKGTVGGGSDTGSSGKDTTPSGKNISNSKASTLITGTAYNDTIKNSSAQVTIQGGDGKDKISLTSAAKNNVIIGGAGNDSIYSSVTSGVLYKYAKGDGNDYIKGWTAKDTLSIIGGAYKTSTTGNDVLVSITGGEKITLAGAKSKTININPSSSSTVSSSGKNISNSKASTLVTGTAYADTIKNTAAQVTIQGGDGKDKISLSSAAKNNVIIGGAGNDSIYSSVTSGVLYSYAKGDGNDYIKGWTAKDTLTITGGAYKTSTTGNDVLVSITGGEKITLAGAKGKTVNINPSSTTTVSSSGKNISNSKASSLVTGTAYNDTIKNTAAQVTLQGGDGKDKISLTSAATKNVIIGGAGNDSIYSSVTSGVLYSYAKGDGNDYIKGWTAKDTLTITGGDYKTSVSGSNVIVSITGGEKITLVGAKGKTLNINPSPVDDLDVVGTSGDDKINNVLAGATISAIAGNDSITNSGANVYIDGGAGTDKITITSSANKNTVKGGKGNDTIYSSNENVMYLYASGDGNDVIHGFGTSTLNITSGSLGSASVNGDDVILKVGSYTITLKDQVDSEINYKVGSGSVKSTVVSSENELIKEGTDIADNLPNNTNQATISGLGGSDKITNSGNSVSISGGAGHDTISNFGTDVTIRGDAGNDSIITSNSGTFIDGGADNDTIRLTEDVFNATIKGGTGNDVIHLNDNPQLIQYKKGDGKDTIFGFSDGDSVSVTSGKIRDDYGDNGSNTVFYIDDGTNNAIIFRNTSKENFQIENNVITFSESRIITLSGYTDKPDNKSNSISLAVIKALGGNDTIKNTGSLVTIYGGEGNDKISLGSSAENNTIYGGLGNDTIYSNGKGNCIKYAAGDGNDTIYSFSGTDYIEITNGQIVSVVSDLSDKKFYINDKTHFITVKDGTSKNFKIEDNVISLEQGSDFSSMIDNTSDISYLFADNNFETGELQIDSITEISDINYSVGKLENAEIVSSVTNDKISVEVTSALPTSANRMIFDKSNK